MRCSIDIVFLISTVAIAQLPDRLERRLVQEGDWAYEGTFLLPPKLGNGADTRIIGASGCAAIRYLDGTAYFMAGAASNQVGPTNGEPFRVSIPPLKTAPPFNVATEVKRYGDVYDGKRVDLDDRTPNHDFLGCYWDEPTQRWYATYGNGYGAAGDGNATSIVVASLEEGEPDAASGSGSGLAAYKFERLGYKYRQTGILAIPPDFAATYTKGRRLGAGFGGYFSAFQSAGGVSMGPSVVAFDPPKSAHLASLPWTPLVQYPVSPEPGRGKRANRPKGAAPIRQTFDRWPNDKYSWTDWVGGAAWIRTDTVQGLAFFISIGTGDAQYINSQFGAEGAETWVQIYDEADLARVAQGKARPDDIQPRNEWKMRYPGLNYDAFPFASESRACTSVAAKGAQLTFECPNHGYEAEQRIRLYGATVKDFNDGYAIDAVIDRDHFTASNVVRSSFSSATTSGTLTIRPLWIIQPPGLLFGATFDPIGKRVYVALGDGVPWPDSHVAVHVYRLP